MTYLNHNVLFELGYAIANNIVLFINVNTRIQNASSNISSIDCINNIGYSPFSNACDIISALNKIPETPQLLRDLHIADKRINITNDIFYIRNASESQAELDTNKYLDESTLKVHVDDAKEVKEPLINEPMRSIQPDLP